MATKVERDTLAESSKRWLTPVETPNDLPSEDVREGDICYVTSENGSWAYANGNWAAKHRAA